MKFIPTNEIAHILADSLVNNRRLEELRISTDGISSAGLAVFTQVLYQKTNIMATYLSNHTLHTLGWQHTICTDLLLTLTINEEYNKKDAARQKIMKCLIDGNYDLPLSDMKSNVLPHLMAWLGRTDRIGISLVYQVIRATPTLFSFISKSKKRKSSGQ